MLTYLLAILLTILFLFFVVFLLVNYRKNSNKKYEIIEKNPSLLTKDYEQHVRRLNIFRRSNYRGITYYFTKKGGLYYYSKNNVRIYIWSLLILSLRITNTFKLNL